MCVVGPVRSRLWHAAFLLPCSLSLLSAAVSAATTPDSKAKTTAAPANTEHISVRGSYTAAAMNSATGLVMSLKETPQSVTLVTAQLISDKNLHSMEAVLNHTPGVTMVGDASENSQIFVRGYALDTGVQIDGLITTSASHVYSGSMDQGLDPVIAERVEVLKGAAGILSGLGEPSATVNFIRKRPSREQKFSSSASVGSWDSYRLSADVSSALNETGTVKGRAVAAVQQQDSFVDRYQRRSQVFYGVVETSLAEATELSLLADYQQNNTDGVFNWNSNPAFYTDGSPVELGRNFSTSQPWTYWDVSQHSLMAELKHRFNNGWSLYSAYRFGHATIDALAFYPGDYIDKSSGAFVGVWDKTNAALHDRISDTHSFNLYSTGEFSLFDQDHSAVVGFNAGKNLFDNVNYNSDTSDPKLKIYHLRDAGNFAAPAIPASPSNGRRSEQRQSGVYGTVRLTLAEPLKLMLGGRLSNWSYQDQDLIGTTNPASLDNSGIFIPYVGLVYDLTEQLALYSSKTEIFKPGTFFGADGNLLAPAEGSNIEAGLKGAFFAGALNMSAAIYRTQKDREPEFAGLGQLPNGYWIYQSVDGITTDGYELELAGELTDDLTLSGGYTRNTAEDKQGQLRQTYLPAQVLKLMAKYDLSATVTDLDLAVSWRWQSDSYYEGSIRLTPPVPYRQQQPAYSLLDLMLNYQLSPQLSIQLNLNNVLDQHYYRSMWGYADHGEPRNGNLTLRYTL